MAINNTFYNPTTACLNVSNASAKLIAYNNIMMPALKATDFAFREAGSGGSVIYNDYNYIFAVDGAYSPITGAFKVTKAGAQVIVVGDHSEYVVDPGLIDPASGNFRSNNPLVLYGGKPDAKGNRTSMGYQRPEHVTDKRVWR